MSTVSVEVPARSDAETAEVMARLHAAQFQRPNPILRYFTYEHLPAHLQAVSKPVGDLARQMADGLPPGAETTAGLRKLLEAKDCFVRAALPPPAPAASSTTTPVVDGASG